MKESSQAPVHLPKIGFQIKKWLASLRPYLTSESIIWLTIEKKTLIPLVKLTNLTFMSL